MISYNYTRADYRRCRDTVKCSVIFSLIIMAIGAAAFVLMPDALIRIFSKDADVLAIGHHAFPIIGSNFLPAVFSLIIRGTAAMRVTNTADGRAISAVAVGSFSVTKTSLSQHMTFPTKRCTS